MTAGEVWRYASNALEATLHGGRRQSPDLLGSEAAAFGVAAGEKGPDLARLSEATSGSTAGSGAELFRISSLPSVPKAHAPAAVSGPAGAGADWRNIDVDALGMYDEAAEFDKGEASAEEKAGKWRALAASAPKFADTANARASEWDRYAQELAAQEEARAKREEARDQDWAKLGRLLAMKTVVPEADKWRWAGMFVQAYGNASDENPYVSELAKYLPRGAVKVVPGALAAAPAFSSGFGAEG